MMQGKAVWMVVSLALMASLFMVLLDRRSVAADAADDAAVAAIQARILASTVQIEMTGAGRVEDGVEHLQRRRGLGTLVQAGGRRFIITHNHWLLAAGEISSVEYFDAAGERLLGMDGATFLSLVRYQDGGTMFLEAPRNLSGVTPAALGNGAGLVSGDTVWLATRAASGTGVAIIMARVEDVDATFVPAHLRLRGPEGAVVPGDSGGGVWRDGRVIGNLWSVVMEQVTGSWRHLFGAGRATGFIQAGMQPLDGATGLSADDLTVVSGGDSTYERGPQP